MAQARFAEQRERDCYRQELYAAERQCNNALDRLQAMESQLQQVSRGQSSTVAAMQPVIAAGPAAGPPQEVCSGQSGTAAMPPVVAARPPQVVQPPVAGPVGQVVQPPPPPAGHTGRTFQVRVGDLERVEHLTEVHEYLDRLLVQLQLRHHVQNFSVLPGKGHLGHACADVFFAKKDHADYFIEQVRETVQIRSDGQPHRLTARPWSDQRPGRSRTRGRQRT